APAGLNRVFFTNSGSESVDTALKIALAYHRARGEGTRRMLIGRELAYHGVGFGGISVGGIPNNRRAYTTLPHVDHLPHTLDVQNNAFTRGLPAQGAELADQLERLVTLHGAENIAAVIVEPMSGSAGVILPPVGYLQRLREITRKRGVRVIFDEVSTGCGRVGAASSTRRWGVTPDLMNVDKGPTTGAVARGGALHEGELREALMQGPEGQNGFYHGYTYS